MCGKNCLVNLLAFHIIKLVFILPGHTLLVGQSKFTFPVSIEHVQAHYLVAHST